MRVPGQTLPITSGPAAKFLLKNMSAPREAERQSNGVDGKRGFCCLGYFVRGVPQREVCARHGPRSKAVTAARTRHDTTHHTTAAWKWQARATLDPLAPYTQQRGSGSQGPR